MSEDSSLDVYKPVWRVKTSLSGNEREVSNKSGFVTHICEKAKYGLKQSSIYSKLLE